jgi:mono/diheme cytochrome c family protein
LQNDPIEIGEFRQVPVTDARDHMRHPVRLTILVAVLAVAASRAQGQVGDASVGHAFARKACVACHVVEAGEARPRLIAVGPAFPAIAKMPGMTATALHVYLTTSHPKMPNIILTPADMDDVIAYILSLRR